ncbi:MAG: aminoglycoside phosphotransferase family protein [Planctomycetes bacterium]|nr:aminoglycoside phosphotransferase family protein [Planctomycetota bacterium]
MPDLERLLRETNDLLKAQDIPLCRTLSGMTFQDTYNPTVLGHADGRRYVIKVCLRYPEALEQSARVANTLAVRTGLPIPQHICWQQGQGGLPLLVMEWIDGMQLANAFSEFSRTQATVLARDWGRCLAIFHRSQLSESDGLDGFGAAQAHSEHVAQLIGSAHERTRQLSANGWSASEMNAIEAFLTEREAHVAFPSLPGLRKADQDLHDALASSGPPRIVALLDWERVWMGDSLWEVVWVHGRFHLIGAPELWPSFREGYESINGLLPKSPHVGFYAMCRALIAAGHNSHARGLIQLLLRTGNPL